MKKKKLWLWMLSLTLLGMGMSFLLFSKNVQAEERHYFVSNLRTQSSEDRNFTPWTNIFQEYTGEGVSAIESIEFVKGSITSKDKSEDTAEHFGLSSSKSDGRYYGIKLADRKFIIASFDSYTGKLVIKSDEVIYAPEDCSNLFSSLKNLTSIKLDNFDMSEATNLYAMFGGCPKLTTVTFGDGFKSGHPTSLNNMFVQDLGLSAYQMKNILVNIGTSSVTDMGLMFRWCSQLTSKDLEKIFTEVAGVPEQKQVTTKNVVDMNSMFEDCDGITSLGFLELFDTSSLKNIRFMFSCCDGLKNVTIPGGFNSSDIEDISGLFESCTSLKRVDVSGLRTNNVTTLRQMFKDDRHLGEAVNSTTPGGIFGLENWNTSKVTSLEETFSECGNLTSLNLSAFDTSNVTSMYNLFYKCSNLTTIATPANGFDMQSALSTRNMFYGCHSLKSVSGFSFNSKGSNVSIFMFDECANIADTVFDFSNFKLNNNDDSMIKGLTNDAIEMIGLPQSENENVYMALPKLSTGSWYVQGDNTPVERVSIFTGNNGGKKVYVTKVPMSKVLVTDGEISETDKSGMKVSDTLRYEQGTKFVVKANVPENKEFDFWSVEEGDVTLDDAKSEIATFTIDSKNVVLKANFKEIVPEHTEHDWDEGKVTKEGSCTEAGEKTYTCKVCKETRTEEINVLGHKPVTDAKVEATCEKEGLTEGSHCERCGETLQKQEVVPKLSHDWDEGKVTKEASCTEAGEKTYTCKVCKETRKEEIKVLGHKPVIDAKVEATCEKEGLTEGSHCERCGETLKKQEVLPKLSHDWDEGKVTKEASCTEAGEKTYTCKVCKETRTEEIKVLGHKPVIDAKVEATCEKEGLTEGSHCERCGETLKKQEVLPKLSHDWDEGKVTKEASCTETGEKTYTCKVCEEIRTEEIKVLGHKEVIDAKVEATCEKEGLTEGSHCERCGETLKKQEVVPKLSHDWDEGKVTKEASCTEAGEKTYTCKVCKETRTEEIKVLGHKEVIDAKVEATCEKEGLTEGSHCERCGETLKKQEVLPRRSHVFGAWRVTKKATAIAAGKREKICKICGAISQETIAPLKATITLPEMLNNVITTKVKQSITSFKITGLAEGDTVTSIKSSNSKILNVSKVKLGKTASCTLKAGSKKGTTFLTITLKSGLVKKIKVNVQTSTVRTSKLNNVPKTVELKKGKSTTIQPVRVPFTSQEKITYKSSNTKIATVTASGKITGKKKGTVKVTVKSGKKSYSIKVTIK